MGVSYREYLKKERKKDKAAFSKGKTISFRRERTAAGTEVWAKYVTVPHKGPAKGAASSRKAQMRMF